MFWLQNALKNPSICVFVGKVDLQEKLVGGTFLKQQMHNFKSSYAESRPPCSCTLEMKYSIQQKTHLLKLVCPRSGFPADDFKLGLQPEGNPPRERVKYYFADFVRKGGGGGTP